MGTARPSRSLLHFADFSKPHDIHLSAVVAINDGTTNAANGDDVVYHANYDFYRSKLRSVRIIFVLGCRRLLLDHSIIDSTHATKSGQSRRKWTVRINRSAAFHLRKAAGFCLVYRLTRIDAIYILLPFLLYFSIFCFGFLIILFTAIVPRMKKLVP
jgi:hypothetical protein